MPPSYYEYNFTPGCAYLKVVVIFKVLLITFAFHNNKKLHRITYTRISLLNKPEYWEYICTHLNKLSHDYPLSKGPFL